MIPGFAISAGVSLLSGLFSRQSAKSQAKKEEAAIAEANRVATENAARMNLEVRARSDAAALVPHQTTRGVDMDAFMAAAEDYGFNPLTFLRSGALSSFEWACEVGHGAMEAAQAGQYIPQLAPVLAQTKVPGLGEVFGNALTSGANQYFAEAGEQRAFQNDVMKMQLYGAQRQGAFSGSRFGTVPQAFKQSVTKATKSSTDGKTLWDLKVGETLVDGIIAEKMYIPMVDNSTAGNGRVVWVIRNDFPDNDQIGGGVEVSGAYLVQEQRRRQGQELIDYYNRPPSQIERRHLPSPVWTSGRGTR